MACRAPRATVSGSSSTPPRPAYISGFHLDALTSGVPLNHLVDREFWVGSVLMLGTRLCEPCKYLEGLTQQGVMGGLIHRGGLRARILTEGVIRVGDAVRPKA